MKKFCIVPARSGSKGLPNKNILEINGKPMIAYSIEAAINSGCFETSDIYLSTDSLEYFELVKHYGISLHHRGEALSSDTSPSSGFINDFIDKHCNEEDIICLLQPTSPLRDSKQVLEALSIHEDNQTAVVSVCKSDKSPELLSSLENDLSDLYMIDKGYRRQDKKEYYHPNGAIYISDVGTYKQEGSFYTKTTKAFIMDKNSSIDVDDYLDFKLVEILMENRKG